MADDSRVGMTFGAPALAPGDLFKPVSLDESNAVTGLTLTPFSAPKISADTPDTALLRQQLLVFKSKVNHNSTS